MPSIPLRSRRPWRDRSHHAAASRSVPSRAVGLLVWLLIGLTLDACAGSRLPLPVHTDPALSVTDLAAHIEALTDPRTEGRLAGTAGERRAADYLSRAFEAIGLVPEPGADAFIQPFGFTSGLSLGTHNNLSVEKGEAEAATPLVIDRDWRPLAFSRSGTIETSPIVFAGYGLVAPEQDGAAALNDYRTADGDLDVQDKWVLVFRGLPESLEGERRQFLELHASLRFKAMVARDRGARGILFVSGPHGRFRNELVPLRFDASLAGTRISAISLSDDAAETLLSGTGISLEALQSAEDTRISNAASAGDQHESGSNPLIPRPESQLSGHIDLVTLHAEGQNVIGRLQVAESPSAQTIVIGAHFDHLGDGAGSSSLATGDEHGTIHPGADDNASGTALLLEVAEALVAQRAAGLPLGRRDFVFAAWSGEELGLLGSDAWVEKQINPHDSDSDSGGPVAYFNLDMVGRLTNKLIVQGLGSSPDWAAILDAAETPDRLSIVRQQDSYLPTDATSFYTQGVPILSAFTGVHSEYHTPRDTPDLLNLDGMLKIGELFLRIATATANRETPPTYTAQEAPAAGLARSGFRVFLGTIPDYAQTDVIGVRLSGVAPAGPADRAGLRRGDIIVEVDGRTIENLYDYTYALDALRVEVPAVVHGLRDGERIQFEVVPASRD